MTKETTYKILLLLSGVLFALLTGEVYSRISPKHLTYCERLLGLPYCSPYTPQESGWLHTRIPNSVHEEKKKEFDFISHSNSLGISDREYQINKPAQLYRIAVFGDSYTEGIGGTPDSTWPKLLQHIENASLSDSIEAINCGISGSDPVFEYMLLKQKILAYNPDLIIVAFNQSDIFDCVVRGGFERFQSDGSVKYTDPPFWEGFYAHSYLFRNFIHNGLGYDYTLMSPIEYKRRSENAISILDHAVDSLATLCRMHHCQLLLAFHPTLWEVKTKAIALQPVLNYAQSQGITCVNVLDFFLANGVNEQSLKKYYWLSDGHNTSSGYLLLARSIAEQIERDNARSH